MNQPPSRVSAQVILDRVRPRNYTGPADSTAASFFEVQDRAKRRITFEVGQLNRPVGLRHRESAVGCAEVEADCSSQDIFSTRGMVRRIEIDSLTPGKKILKWINGEFDERWRMDIGNVIRGSISQMAAVRPFHQRLANSLKECSGLHLKRSVTAGRRVQSPTTKRKKEDLAGSLQYPAWRRLN